MEEYVDADDRIERVAGKRQMLAEGHLPQLPIDVLLPRHLKHSAGEVHRMKIATAGADQALADETRPGNHVEYPGPWRTCLAISSTATCGLIHSNSSVRSLSYSGAQGASSSRLFFAAYTHCARLRRCSMTLSPRRML